MDDRTCLGFNDKISNMFLYLGLYVVILIAISVYVSRKDSDEGFLIANRDRKWWVIALSKFAAAIGVGYFITYTGYAYEYGLGVYLTILGAFIGYLSFGLWASPRIYKNSRDKKYYTQGDYVEDKTGDEKSRKITNLISNIILFGWLMVGIVGGAKVISHFGLISYELALLGTVVFITLYIIIAGFKAVLATDILQGFIVLIFVIGLAWIITQGVGIGTILSTQTGTLDIPTAIGFLLFGSLSVYSYSNFYQLIYAAKDAKTAKIGISTSIIPILFIASLLLMIGMFMFTQDPNLDSGLVFLVALENYLPSSLLPLGIVLFFAGLMSSADTNVYGISSHYVLSKQNVETSINKIRKAVIWLGAISIVIGLFMRDVVDITILAAAFSVVLSIGMIYLIAGGKNAFRFKGSVFTGIVCYILAIAFLGIEPTIVLPVIVGCLLGLSYNGWFSKKSTIAL